MLAQYNAHATLKVRVASTWRNDSGRRDEDAGIPQSTPGISVVSSVFARWF